MKKFTKNFKNQNGGFVQAIILIVIVLFVMRHYGITLTGLWYQLKALLASVW